MASALKLFLIFFQLGFFSFGGGYSMIPLAEQAMTGSGIEISAASIADISAIAGIVPGPVGVNLAVGFGYKIAGFSGVFAAGLGVLLPSLITVVIAARAFDLLYRSRYFKWALDGLKPVIVGIIAYAAIGLAAKNGVFFISSDSAAVNGANVTLLGFGFNLPSLLIVAASLALLLKTKVHPVFLIAAGAVVGMLVF